MRLLTVGTALLLLAGLAGEAAAKEVVGVTACGSSDCRSTRDRDVIGIVESGGSPSIPEAATRSAWYRLRAKIRIEGAHDEQFQVAFIPRTRMLRMGDDASGYAWTLLSRPDARALRALVAGLAPFPAAKLRGIVPGTDEHAAPASASTHAVTAPPSSDGGPSPLPWIAGAVVLLGAVVTVVWRRRGWRRPRPAS